MLEARFNRREYLSAQLSARASEGRSWHESARDALRISVEISSVRLDLMTRDERLAARLGDYFARFLRPERHVLEKDLPPDAELWLEASDAKIAVPGLWDDEDPEFAIQGDFVVQRDFAARRIAPGADMDGFSRAFALVNTEVDDSFHNLLRWFMPSILLEHGAFLVHGGGIVHQGLGYVFFGQSGAGKTTSTGLVAASDLDAYLLGDDAVILRIGADGTPLLESAPLGCGYSRLAPAPRSVPIAGLFNLRQAGENRIEALRPSQAVAALLACAMHASPVEGAEERFDLALRFASTAPGIDALHFKPDPSFWPMILAAKSSRNRRENVQIRRPR